MKHLTKYTTLLKLSLVMLSTLLLVGLALLTVPAARGATENLAEHSPANLTGLRDLSGLKIDFKERSLVPDEDLIPRRSANLQLLDLPGSQPFPLDKPGTYLPLAQGTTYTVPIVVDNTGNTSVLTDYQVSMTLDTATLISQGRMRSDCGDIRFYDGTQTIPLPYWLESGCDSSSTKVWVKVPTIPAASTEKIYLTHGDSSRISESNGDAVFEFFDDFDGTGLDTSKWAVDSGITYVISNSKLIVSDSPSTGWFDIYGFKAIGYRPVLQNGFILEAKDVYYSDEASIFNFGLLLTDGISSFGPIRQSLHDSWVDDTGQKDAQIDSNGYVTGFGSLLSNSNHQFKIQKISNNQVTIYWDDVTVLGPLASTTNIDSLYIQVNRYSYFYSYGENSIDLIRIRKFTIPEPTTFEAGLVLSQIGSSTAPLGGVVTSNLTIQNNDVVTASNAVITYTLPVSIAFVSASITPHQTNPLVWQLGNISPLTSTNLTITGSIRSAATIGSSLLAIATVTSDLIEANLTNNTASFTSTVVAGSGNWLALTVAGEVDMLIPFSATVTAYDKYGNIATGYTGTVTLISTDTSSGFPITHQFITTDQGVYTFTNLVLQTAGVQIITATDEILSQTHVVMVDDDVVVDQNTTWRDTSINLKSLVVTGTGTVLTLERLPGITTPTLITLAESITVGMGAFIQADGQGYTEGVGLGAGNYCSWWACANVNGGGSGAGYGDFGGIGVSNSNSGAPYGSVLQPTDLGSGGGGRQYAGAGGAGGGAIKLVATSLTNNGEISVNGLNGGTGAGGGSGGSLWIETGTLAGNGIFKANGGAGGGTQAGGGAGGRIAIYYDINNSFIFDSDHIQASRGSGYQNGGPGTIYLGHVDPLASTVEISPLSIPANGVAGGTITVTLRTTAGALIAEQPVSVSLKSGGQSSTYLNGQPASVGTISLGETNADGVVTATITSTSSETKTVEATSGIVRLVNPAMVFFDPDFVSPIASTVSIIGPSTVAANGSEIEVRVTARDKFGNLVPNIPTTLGTSPEVTITEINTVTNQLGQATYRISHDQPAHVVISAMVNSLRISNVVTATFEGIDLNVSLSASPQVVTAGYPITYYLAVANNGFLTATNIVVTNTLPAGVEFISHVGNFTPTRIGNQFVWQIGDLGPGQATDSFSLVGTVNLTAPTTLTNQVTAAASETELNLADNIESVSTTVVPPIPLLAVSPTYPTLRVLLGQTGVLTITVRNAGTGMMTNAQVVAAPTLPSWITVNQTYPENIPPGQVAVFTITANTAEVNTSGHYRDIVTVKADNVDEEYVLLDIHVQGPTRDLQLSVTNNTGAVVAGANVTLREDIFVVTEGQFGTQPYYRQGVTDQAGHLTFAALETGKTYNFSISAYNHDSKSGIVTVDEGIGTQAWTEILTGLPRLTVSPGTLAFSIARGSLSQQALILRNPGAVTLTNISLTNPDNIPWIYLSQPAAGTVIPPDGELAVWVNAAPPLTETISQHQDSIEITASNGNSAMAALDITLNDGLTRTLCISVQTEVNSPLTDGLVRLVDQTGQVVATNGVTETVQKTLVQATDSNGQTCFADLKPGQYLATVGRGELKLGEKGIELAPGGGVQEEVITVDEPSVIVNWSVMPTLIDDVYTTVMTMTFVPESKPALTLSPRSISLCQPGSNGIVTETVTIHNFFPVAFTLPVLELEALGNVRATITTTSGSAFSVLPDGKTTLPLDDIPPYAHIQLTLYASLAEDPGQCLAGDAGTILLKLSANYVHYTPNYSWYGGASVSYPQLTLNQTATIPLKLRNSGYPAASNLNGRAPTMQNITLSQPQQLTWMTITPTNIISLPLQHEASLTLTVNPPQWLARGTYYDHVLVKATNGVTAVIGLKAEMSADGLKVETQLVTPLNSDNPDQQASVTRSPGLAYPLTYLPPSQAAGEPQIKVWGHLVASQNAEIGEVIDIFGDVWNLQVLNCDCSQPGQPPKQRPTWSWLGNQLIAVKVGDPSPPGSGAAFAPEFKDNLVRLRVSQRYALEREAFNAQLELINGTAAQVNNIEVDITITDEGGTPVLMRQPGDPLTSTQTITPYFPTNSRIPTSTLAINMPSAWQENGDANFIIIPDPPTVLGNLDEDGERQLASWTIIPDASGITSSTGKNYFVYATIRYNDDKVIVTTKEMITVQPQPKILLDYFIPRYVYADQAVDWQVIATNVGYGPANNFSMGQPKIEILKQSDHYPTNFTVGGQSSLNFARLEAGQQVVGTWQITAGHDGYFRDIEAACQHQNYQGVELPPLIYCKPTIHIVENAPPDDASQWGKDNACTLGSWQAFDSDPVNTYSGNFTYSHLDVSIPTWGLPLAFEGAYNSRDPEDGPLGWGWTHNYNVELIRESYIPAVTLPMSDTQVLGSSGGGSSSPGSSGSFLTRTSARIGKIATPPGLTLFGQTQDIMTVRLPHGSRAYFEIRDNGDTFVPFPGVKAELIRQGNYYRLTLPQEQAVYIFNLDQKLAYLEDKNGNRLTFEYSKAPVPSEQRLLNVTDPAGRSLAFAYDANKRLISLTDPLSRTMAFGYTNGYLTSVADFRGQTTTYAYTPPGTDPATGESLPGQLAAIADANNHVEVTNHYDGKRRVDWQEDAEHNRATFTYAGDDAGAVTTIMTDPAGHITIDHYNDKGQLVKQTDTYGFFEVYEYDDTYNMTRLVDKKGRETRYDWNDCGCDYERVTDPLGYTTSLTYNDQRQLTGIADKRGYVTTMTYDSHANPLTVSDPLAGTVVYSYGSRGELLSKTDENNHSTFYGYDLYGNTAVITDALGQVTRMTYDLAGRLLSTTDALGRATRYNYDPGNNLLQVIDPLTGTTTFTYDNVGNRLAMMDALNQSTLYTYDARNNLTQVTNPLGGTRTFAYDTNRNLMSETNENNQVTTYQYDGLHRVLITTNMLSGALGYTYDAVGNKLTEQDANGSVTSYVYDANDRIVETIYADGSKMTASYDPADNLLSLTDAENRTLSYEYDALGRVTILHDPITGTVVYRYDAAGNQTAVTDAAGRTTTYTYDALNRLVQTTDPLAGATTSSYDAVGNMVSLTDAEGRTTTFHYDNLNRLSQVTDPLSGTTASSYDAVGNKRQVFDPLDRLASYDYDALNRLVQVTDPLGGATSYTYDALGNLTGVTDSENHTTTYQYDSLNRLIVIVNPKSEIQNQYTYDANGNLKTETNAAGRVTRYNYDAFNQVITLTNAAGEVTAMAYDKVGHLIRRTDPEQRTTHYQYDALDRLTQVTDPLGNLIHYTYDPVGNKLAETDPEGRTTHYVYDALDRLLAIRDALGGELAYSYDRVGNRLGMVDPTGSATHYRYDALNRLVDATNALSRTTAYTYDAVGNPLSVTDPKGRTSTYQYDALNRLIRSSDPLDQTTAFTYSLTGNLTATTNPLNQTTRYTYDTLNRPIEVERSTLNVQRYTYDALGNLLSQTDANNHTTTFGYDTLNRLITTTNALNGVTTYTYDRAGNLRQSVNPMSQTVNYTYDALGRLVEVADPFNGVTAFKYDKVGNQIEVIDPLLRSTRYGYDLLNRLTVITDALDGVTTYVYDPAGNQISRTDAAGRTTTTEYDALHRPIKTTDPLSGLTRFSYDEAGNLVQIQNPKSQIQNFEYDTLDRLVAAADALGGITTYSYDAIGNLTQAQNPQSQSQIFEYDALNRLTQTTNALGGITRYEYDLAGNLIRQTDPLGLVVTTTYDALNRPTQVQRGTFNVQHFTYDALGNLLNQTDANDHTTTYTYDALNRVKQVTDPLDQSTRFEYDLLGNLKATIDPLDRRTQYTYDALYRLEAVTDPLNRVTHYGYDKVGNQTGLTDAEGITTRYEYDALNRLAQVTQNYVSGGPQNASTNVATRFEYDALGNLTKLIDPLQHEQTFAYDALNRITAKRDALLHETAYDYDALGNVIQITDPKSQISNLQYDALNRLTSLTRPDETINFSYDAAGNRLSMDDSTGTTSYEYDDLYRLTQVTHPSPAGNQPSIVGYSYDAKGNRTALTYPDGTQIAYTYDAADRLTQIADWSGGLTRFSYDGAGQLVQKVLPNGIASTYEYDPAGQLARLTHTQPLTSGPQLLASYAYTYDNAGNRTQAVETVLSQIFTPTAVFTATPVSGVAPLSVTFTSAFTYAASLTWDFGDGITETQTITDPQLIIHNSQFITHNYTTPGLYTVTLAAANDGAAYSFTRTDYIAVLPAGTFAEMNGLLVIEAENFDRRSSGATHDWLLKTGQAGYTGTSYLQPLPDIDTLYPPEAINGSPQVDYPIYFTTPGTYTIWLRGYPTNAAGDSVHVGLAPSSNPSAPQLTSVTGFAPRGWNWTSDSTNGEPATLIISAPGSYTLTLWMREDGLRLDRLLLVTDPTYLPGGDGPAESQRVSEGFQLFAVPVSRVQQTLLVNAGEMEGWKVGTNFPALQLSNLVASSPPRFPASPIAQDPTLLLLSPLTAGAPLAGRRKWRRSAWWVLLILLALGLFATGTAIAADMTADHGLLTTEEYSTFDSSHIMYHASRGTSASLPQLQLGSAGTLTTTYSYDPLYRLTAATDSSGGSFGYTYDDAGNRLSYSINGAQAATYTYNAANWLTEVRSQTSVSSYQYDANGNLLSDGTYSYSYDSANRLTSLTSLADTMNFVYNGEGVRVAQITNGQQTAYVQDVAVALPQVLIAQQGDTISKYLRGLGLIGEQRSQAGPNALPAAWQYHLPDALGSVRQITDPTGQLLLTQRFDPFGNLLQRSSVGGPRSVYGFAGEEQDSASGQLFLRARSYNPATGRFLQADPVMGSPADPRTLHHYSYSFNNPVNYTDPSGLMPPWLGQFDSETLTRIGPNSYAPVPPTQGGPGYNHPFNLGAPARSVNGADGGGWSTRSDVYARQQSQGFRPKRCGFTDVLFGFGNSALNGNLLKDSFEFAQHGREIALSIMPMAMWELGFQLAIGFSPFDWLYDLGSLVTGRDIVSGETLSQWEKAAIVAGFLTLGFGDDVIEAGNALKKLKALDEAAAASKAGKKLLGNLVDVSQTKGVRDNLGELSKQGLNSLSGLSKGADEAAEAVADVRRGASHADEVADAVLDAKRGLSDLDEVPASRLDDLDALMGKRPVFSQVETRRALSGGSDQALSHRLLKDRYSKLQGELDILRQREARFGGNAPMDLVDQIHDYEHAIASAEKAWAGKISVQKFTDETNNLRLNVSFNRWTNTLQTPDDFSRTLKQLHKNHGILEERLAKYGGMAPVGLINQIDGYKSAIGLAEEVRAGRLGIQEFRKGITNLNLDLTSPSKLKRLIQTPDNLRREVLRLQKNYNILQERVAKLGGDAPLGLLSQIEDYKSAIGSAEEVMAGRLSIQEFRKGTAALNLVSPSGSILKRPLNTPGDFETVLLQFHKNRNILRERAAKFGSIDVPLPLQNQIQDYEYAIDLAQEARAGRLSVQEFRKGVMPLILDY